ncbi:MAG: hypothetical protein AAFP77_19660 [Bacteroidota bacterium]
MNIELKEDFEIVEQGTHYKLPCYEVVDGKGIQLTDNYVDLNFVRGSKLKDEEVERREGTLHEHLLSAMISDLQFKNGLVPSREGSITITKLQEALQWLRQRQVDRVKRSVVGTYQK